MFYSAFRFTILEMFSSDDGTECEKFQQILNFWTNILSLVFVSGAGYLWSSDFWFCKCCYIHNKIFRDHNNIEFLQFLYALKLKLDIENNIILCKRNNATQTFNKFCILTWPTVMPTYIRFMNKVVYYLNV